MKNHPLKSFILLFAPFLFSVSAHAGDPDSAIFIPHPKADNAAPSSMYKTRGWGDPSSTAPNTVDDLLILDTSDSAVGKIYGLPDRIDVVFASKPAGARVLVGDQLIAVANTRGSLQKNYLKKVTMAAGGKQCASDTITMEQKIEDKVVYVLTCNLSSK